MAWKPEIDRPFGRDIAQLFEDMRPHRRRETVEDADAQEWQLCGRAEPGRVAELPHRFSDRCGMFDQCRALQGENRRAHRTVEELNAERLLETGDHLRDRGLRQFELLCRSHHGSGLGNDGENFERANGQPGAERRFGEAIRGVARQNDPLWLCWFAHPPFCPRWRRLAPRAVEVILSISHAEEHENRDWRSANKPARTGGNAWA